MPQLIREGDQPMPQMFPDDRPQIPPDLWQTQPQQPKSGFSEYPLDYVLDQEICSMVVMRQKSSEYWRREKRIIWDTCWNHYKQVYDATGKEPWQSTTFMPATSKVVETIVANLHATSMAPHTPIEYQANLPQMQVPVSNHNSIIANDFDRSQFKVKWTDFLRSLVLLGTGIGKVGYAKEERMVLVKKRNRMAALNGLFNAIGASPVDTEKFSMQKMITKDWATFDYRDPYDIYPEPYTFEIDDTHWIIEKAKITNAELIAGANDPDPMMRLRNITPALLTRSNDSRIVADPEKQARRLALMQQQVAMNYQDPDSPHELYEYWGPVPELWMFPEHKNDPQAKYRMVPGWIWVVDKQWVVRKQLNPFRDAMPPYVRGHYIRIPGQWYGVGAAELMAGLQIEKNELRNTRIDNVNLILNKIMAVLKDKVPPGEWNRLKSAPGAIWLFEGVNKVADAVMPIDVPDITKDAYIASKEIDSEIQETTAANSATLGVGGQEADAGGKTFRGQLLNKQASADRFMLYARVLEVCGLADATRKYYQRIYQYKSYDDIAAIIGPEKAQQFEFIPPEDLDRLAKLVPLGVLTTETKGVKLAQLEAFHQQFRDQWWYKGIDVARKELNEMGYPDADQFVFSDEEIQQYNEARKQALAEMPPGTGVDVNRGEGSVSVDKKIGSPGGGPPSPTSRNSPMGQPVAGNSPGRNQFMGALPARPANGPGGSPSDMNGRPVG